MTNKEPIRRNGYLYGPKTAAGFLRMQRLGIPRPLFRIQDKMARLIKKHLKERIAAFIRQYAEAAKQSGLTAHNLTQDSPEDDLADLMRFFEAAGEEFSAEAAAEARVAIGAANYAAKEIWEKTEAELDREFMQELRELYAEEQTDYLTRLQRDQDPELSQIIATFSLDQRKLYNENMEALRMLYLDGAKASLSDFDNTLKLKFIDALEAYVTGQTDTLNIEKIVKSLQVNSEHMGQFFARDQMQRFNKATTLAQFTAAGVTKVKWCTCHDGRVRETHKALDGQVFPINALPPEVDDYNCRCGLIPAEYAD